VWGSSSTGGGGVKPAQLPRQIERCVLHVGVIEQLKAALLLNTVKFN